MSNYHEHLAILMRLATVLIINLAILCSLAFILVLLDVPTWVAIGASLALVVGVHVGLQVSGGGQSIKRLSTHHFSPEKIVIHGVEHVWEIDDLEDFGPGYIISTTDGEFACLCSDVLPTPIANLTVLGETIVLTINSETSEIMTACFSGTALPVRGCFSATWLPEDFWAGFHIIPFNDLITKQLQGI